MLWIALIGIGMLAVALGLYFWWRAVRVTPEKPPASPNIGTLSSQPSRLSFPLQYATQAFEHLINEKFQGLLYTHEAGETDEFGAFKLAVYKIEDIEMTFEGNRVRYALALRVELDGKVEADLVLTKWKQERSLHFSMVLHLESRLSLDQDCKVLMQTKLLRLDWREKPTVQVAFFKIGIAGFTSTVLEARIPDILAKVDAAAYEHVDLRSTVADVWDYLQDPLLISAARQDVWVKTTPYALSVSPLQVENGFMRLDITIEALIETVVGDSPGRTQIPLPPVQPRTDEGTAFEMNILSAVSFPQINEVLMRELKDRAFSVRGRNISIAHAALYGSWDEMVMEAHLMGDISGVIYFRGKPVFDEQDHCLTLESFDYDARTETFLLKAADWFLHDNVKERIAQRIRLPLRPYIERLPLLIRQAVRESEAGQYIGVTVENLDVRPSQIIIGPEGLQMMTRATGYANILLKI